MKRLTAVLLLAAVLLCACAQPPKSYVNIVDTGYETRAVNTALNALIDGNADVYLSVFPPQMAEDYKKFDVYSYFFCIKDMDAWLDLSLASYNETYGENIKIMGKISSVMEITVDALGDANLDYYTYVRYVTEENTEKVISAVLDYTIKGDKSSEEKTAKIYFVKQDGDWYLHPCFALYSF